MSTTIGLKLSPLDVLFFRDGRPFGAATRGQSGLPMPQTLAGAVWTQLLAQAGCDFDQLVSAVKQGTQIAEAIRQSGGPEWLAQVRVRGPWLARGPRDAANESEDASEVLIPTPAILQVAKDPGTRAPGDLPLSCLVPLSPKRRLPGWCPGEFGQRALWLHQQEPTEAAGGYLKPAAIQSFLEDPRRALLTAADLVKPDDLYDLDHRTGIGIEPDQLTAQEGMIYGASFLALKPGVFLYAEVVLPDGCAREVIQGIDTLPFGGEGRRVGVTALDTPFRWPEPPAAGPDQRTFVLLTTPGIFAARWKPAALNGQLLAAAVPGSVAVSGWDLARGGPKPVRFAAQAGSVYFLECGHEDGSLNLLDSLADREDDRAQGWGCYLKGVWTYE